jgi:hypothetical protein
MALTKFMSVKMTHIQRIDGLWCMLIETTADISLSTRDQSWHIRNNVWVSLNETFPDSLLEFVTCCEENVLNALGVPLAALLVKKTYLTYTQIVTARIEDINIGSGWYRLKTCHDLSCTVLQEGGQECVLPR